MKKYFVERIQIIFLIMIFVILISCPNGVLAKAENKNPDVLTNESSVGVSYRGHVENYGNMPKPEGTMITGPDAIGTRGQGLRVEGFWIKLTGDLPAGASIHYQVHVENEGWLDTVSDGAFAGTEGRGLRVESIKIWVEDLPGYSVYYRGHVQNVGNIPQLAGEWGWMKDGEEMGTTGSGLRLEELQVKIVKQGSDWSEYYSLLENINGLQEKDYTDGSWSALQNVIKTNKVSETDSQNDIDKATEAIRSAYEELFLIKPTVYDKKGTYGPRIGTETIKSNVEIKSDGVVLKNLIIRGDLIITEEVEDGDVTLNNITVEGTTYIRGGGENSIHINSGQYHSIVIERTPTGVIRVVAKDVDGTEVILNNESEGEEVILEGDFDSAVIKAANVKVQTKNGTINEMIIEKDSSNCEVYMDKTSMIKNMEFNEGASILGQGTIKNADVKADGVTYEKAPQNQNIDEGVTELPKNESVKVTGISLSAADNSSTVLNGGTLQITAAVLPLNAENKRVIWSVVNGTGSASISSSGVLTGIKDGTVIVRATAADGSGKVGSLLMSVSQTLPGMIKTVDSISGGTENPRFTVTLTNDTFTTDAETVSSWSWNKGETGLEIASVTKNSSQQVTIQTSGSSEVGTISFKALASALTKNISSNTVNVNVNPVYVSSISVNGSGGVTTVTKGDTLQMTATILPVNALDKNVDWMVFNETGTASISSNGLLAATKAGTVTVRARAADGSGTMGTTKITIVEPTAGIISTQTLVIPGDLNSEIVVKLNNDTFTPNANQKELWSFTAGDTGVTLQSITRDSETQVTIKLSGTAEPGSAVLLPKADALTKGVVTNALIIKVSKIEVTGVLVSGIKMAGSTLTASVTPVNATVNYQWQRADTVAGTYLDIGSATSSNYTLTAEDQGKYLKVKVTGTGNYFGTVTSGADSTPVGSVIEWSESAITTIEADNDNPPYQLMQINYKRNVEVTSSIMTITMKDPSAGDIGAETILWKSSGGISMNSNAYWQWSYRNANSVFNGDSLDGTSQADLDSIERSNDYQLKVGSIVTIRIDATKDKKSYSITRDYTITSDDVANSTYNNLNTVDLSTALTSARDYSYPVDSSYTYTGLLSVTDNVVLMTYSAIDDLGNNKINVMNDMARYLGALYWFDSGNSVKSVIYSDQTYTWSPEDSSSDQTGLKGSNWYGGNATLVSKIVTDFQNNLITNQIELKILDEKNNEENVILSFGLATLSKPVNLQAEPSGDGIISLSWSTVANATNYTVYEALNESDYIVVTTDATGSSYRLTGLTPGQKYSFKIMATANGYNNSSESEVATAIANVDDQGSVFYGNKILISNESTDTDQIQSTGNLNIIGEEDLVNVMEANELEPEDYRINPVIPFEPTEGQQVYDYTDGVQTQEVITLGSEKSLIVDKEAKTNPDTIAGRCAYIGTYVQVWVDNDVNAKVKLTDDQAEIIGKEFDNNIYSLVETNFGIAPNIDGDGKITILCYDIADSYSGPGSAYKGGFFWGGDLYEKNISPNSNEMEIFYVDTYPTMLRDPYNPDVANPDVTKVYSTLVHEFQHMVNFNQNRLIEEGDSMDTWLDEALSMAAEDAYEGRQTVRIDYYNKATEIQTGLSLLEWNGSLDNYALSYLFSQYLRTQIDQAQGNGQGMLSYKSIINDEAVNYLAVENEIQAKIDPELSFGEFMTNFRSAMLLKADSGPFGFNNESGFDSIETPVYTGNITNLKGGGALVKSISGAFTPETYGGDITFVGIY